MSEIIGAFLCGEIGNGATDPTPEARDRMLGRLAQMRLEFAEGQFDWVEVRRILRKINQRRARSIDGLRDAGDPVHRQLVHETISPRLKSGRGIASRRQETSASVGNLQAGAWENQRCRQEQAAYVGQG